MSENSSRREIERRNLQKEKLIAEGLKLAGRGAARMRGGITMGHAMIHLLKSCVACVAREVS